MEDLWVMYFGNGHVFATPCPQFNQNQGLKSLPSLLNHKWLEIAEVIVGPDGDVWKDRYGQLLNRHYIPKRIWNGRMLAVIIPIKQQQQPHMTIGYYVNIFDTNSPDGFLRVSRAEDIEQCWDRYEHAANHAETICMSFGGTVVYEHARPGIPDLVLIKPKIPVVMGWGPGSLNQIINTSLKNKTKLQKQLQTYMYKGRKP